MCHSEDIYMTLYICKSCTCTCIYTCTAYYTNTVVLTDRLICFMVASGREDSLDINLWEEGKERRRRGGREEGVRERREEKREGGVGDKRKGRKEEGGREEEEGRGGGG